MKEIEKRIDFFKNQRSRSVNINLGNLGVISEAEKEAEKIYKKFKDGCNFVFQTLVDGEINLCCGAIISDRGILLCPNCKEIKEIWKKLNSEEEVKTCSTKHVIPPKSKDSGILPNFT